MARVLIVDDESAVLDFLDRVMSDAGYQTVLARDGIEALEQRRPFDLLLTDLMMPRMSGDVLAREMLRTNPGLKVLYLTAYSDSLFTRKRMLWDGEAFLEKPATPEGVVEAVQLLLTGRIARSA